jgi:hypothetical protein
MAWALARAMALAMANRSVGYAPPSPKASTVSWFLVEAQAVSVCEWST